MRQMTHFELKCYISQCLQALPTLCHSDQMELATEMFQTFNHNMWFCATYERFGALVYNKSNELMSIDNPRLNKELITYQMHMDKLNPKYKVVRTTRSRTYRLE